MRTVLVSALFVCAAWAHGADEPRPDEVRRQNRTAVEAIFAEQRELLGTNGDCLVLNGVVADRRLQTVTLYAEATGLDQSGQPPEFFMIGDHSGHDYEALAISLARPSDVHRALVFIGMQPGAPADPAAFRFCPKGERVIMSVRTHGSSSDTVRAESLLVDTKSGAVPPAEGFVFVGSQMIPATEGSADRVYAADAREPGSVAANYNDPTTVLDVPRRAPQGEVYGNMSVNPKACFPKGALLDFTLKPEPRDGTKRVVDAEVTVTVAADKGAGFAFSSSGPLPPGTATSFGSVDEFLAAADACRKADHDVHILFRPTNSMPLSSVRTLCALLADAEDAGRLRVEPPVPGAPYYKAFLPDPQHRDRTTRPSQPWEVYLQGAGTACTGKLVKVNEEWEDGKTQPNLKTEEFAVSSPTDLRAALDTHGPGLRVVFFFAPSTLDYGTLLRYVAAAIATHPTMFVFLD